MSSLKWLINLSDPSFLLIRAKMLIMFSLPLISLVPLTVDEVANSGLDIISKSQLAGQTVRQCSCNEQRECVLEMKAQAKECTVPCFAKFNAITSRPADLRKCFEDKDDILKSFLNCFEERVDACVDTMNGPQIPKADISTIFAIGEKKITYQSATLQSIIAPIKNVVDAAGDFAKCVKDCFIQKNTKGFCFDRKGCLPYIGAKKAKNSFKTCTRKMNWKREAGELCQCSVDAGVTQLKQYCSMFSLMGRKGRQSRH